MPQPDHRLYRAVLRLYPKTHRHEYGEQMVQTLDDMLQDSHGHTMAVWWRVVLELPASLVQEHIQHIQEGKTMTKTTNKRLIIAGVAGLAVIGGAVAVVLAASHKPYQPTTLAKVPHATHPPTCLQTTDNAKLAVKPADKSLVDDAVVASIIDVPAGTNVDVYLKTFAPAKASGTAIYGGTFGSYNFVATKSSAAAEQGNTAGWQVSQLERCSR